MCQEKKEIAFSIYYRYFIAELLCEVYVAVICVVYLVVICIWVWQLLFFVCVPLMKLDYIQCSFVICCVLKENTSLKGKPC